jgi:hypothetical protein
MTGNFTVQRDLTWLILEAKSLSVGLFMAHAST